MRKWILWMAAFLSLCLVAPVQATRIVMTNDAPPYWGWLKVDYDWQNSGQKSTQTVGAGRFYTSVMEGEKRIDTFSYCVDLGNYFSWDKEYAATIQKPQGPYREAAWLVHQYDPLTGRHYQGVAMSDDEAQRIAMTLQLAIWKTLYDDRFDHVSGGDDELLKTMRTTLGSVGTLFDAGNFFVAEIDGQDQLVAQPVPEPTTILLLGFGLLGLGAVGRKRLK